MPLKRCLECVVAHFEKKGVIVQGPIHAHRCHFSVQTGHEGGGGGRISASPVCLPSSLRSAFPRQRLPRSHHDAGAAGDSRAELLPNGARLGRAALHQPGHPLGAHAFGLVCPCPPNGPSPVASPHPPTLPRQTCCPPSVRLVGLVYLANSLSDGRSPGPAPGAADPVWRSVVVVLWHGTGLAFRDAILWRFRCEVPHSAITFAAKLRPRHHWRLLPLRWIVGQVTLGWRWFYFSHPSACAGFWRSICAGHSGAEEPAARPNVAQLVLM